MKKAIAILLTLVMVLGMVSTAWAAETYTGCNGEHTGDWQAFPTDGAGITYADFSGNYYLVGDSVLTDTLILTSGTVNLCLNGYALRAVSGKHAFFLNGSVELNIYDCPNPDAGTHYFDKSNDLWKYLGTNKPDDMTNIYEMTGGVITGGAANGSGYYANGGAIRLNTGHLNMDGVDIIGNSASNNGGGIYVYRDASVVHMKNCDIFGNTAGGEGSGIYIRCNKESTFDNLDVMYNTGGNGARFYSGVTETTNCSIIDNKSADGSEDSVQVALREGPCTFNGTFGNIYLEGFTNDESTKNVTINGSVTGDVTVGLSTSQYASDVGTCTIQINASVTGDVVVPVIKDGKGNVSITINNEVGGSVIVDNKKSDVTIAEGANITGDVTVTGGEVTLDEAVGNVIVSGGIVHVNDTADSVTVSGDGVANINGTATNVTNDGGTTNMTGTATNVTSTGGTTNLTGTATNVTAIGGTTNVNAGATVTGDVTVSGGDGVISDKAELTNPVAGIFTSDTETVTLPAASVTMVDIIEVTLKDGVKLALDEKVTNAVQQKITDKGTDNVVITVEKVDKTSLTEGQQKQLKNRNATVYEITILVGDEELTTFDGTITATIPYTKAAEKNTLTVYCVTDTALEEIEAGYKGGDLVATLNHLSTYAIVEVEPPIEDSKPTDPTNPEPDPKPDTKPDLKPENKPTKPAKPSHSVSGSGTTLSSPKTFDAGIALYGVMALTSAMGAAYVTGKKK